jgi:hypothetical protein
MRYDNWQNTLGQPMLTSTTSGYINEPTKPIISGQIGSSGTFSGSQKIPFDDFWVQRGITYDSSTRRFTVPVAGIYRITMNPFKLQSAAGTRVIVGINTDSPSAATNRGMCYGDNTAVYQTMNINSVVSLSANDWITFLLSEGSLYNATNDRFNQFSIEMIA